MDCQEKLRLILRDLTQALQGNDKELRERVEDILKKYRPKRRRGNFELKRGNTYYIDEKSGKLAYKILVQVLERGLPALYITRMNPDTLEIRELYPNLNIYWLTSLKRKGSIAPNDLTKIYTVINDFVKEQENPLVLLDGIETVITNTDFKRTLNMLQKIRDLISQKRGIFLVPINLETLETREKALFEKEMMNKVPGKKTI